jgi:hypothetical protein
MHYVHILAETLLTWCSCKMIPNVLHQELSFLAFSYLFPVCYSYLMNVIRTWWRLFVLDEGYSCLMKVIRTWWRLFVHDEGYSYMMKVIRTWWRLFVPEVRIQYTTQSPYATIMSTSCMKNDMVRRLVVGVMVFKATFNNISAIFVAFSFIGGGNRSTRRKPQTCCKSLTNFIT